jgi:hypothetical protein
MSTAAKTRLYTSIVLPTLTYGSPWCGHAAPKATYNGCRRCRKARCVEPCAFLRTADVHRQTGIPLLRDFLDNMNEKFFVSLENHPNPLVQAPRA